MASGPGAWVPFGMTLTPPWQSSSSRVVPQTSGPGEPGDPGEVVDVVVVGAGLTGLTTALLLARAGRSVTVVEARHAGAGTTGRSTAKISVLQGTRLSQISRKQPSTAVQDYVDANVEGQAWLTRFCRDHGVDVQERPAITYAVGIPGVALARRELEVAQASGLPVRWEERVDLPFAHRGGVVLDGQGQVDPQAMVDALADQVREHGARLLEGVRVTGVSGSGPVTVRTEGGDLRASQVVVATNMPVLDRGGFFARMEAQRSYGLAFEAPEGLDGMYLSADGPSRSLRDAPYDGGTLLLVGGNGHPTGRVRSTLQQVEDLRAWTRRNVPTAGTETHVWSSQDYVPAHGLPYAGPLLPGADHLLVAGGYAKWGMTNAVAAALVLSARVLGGVPPSWARAFRTDPRVELRGAAELARANAAVGIQMSAGWLRPVAGVLSRTSAQDGPQVAFDRWGPPTASAAGREALSGVCTHLGGVVRWNDAERSWDCPLHGSRFDDDGTVLEGPATCGLRRRGRA